MRALSRSNHPSRARRQPHDAVRTMPSAQDRRTRKPPASLRVLVEGAAPRERNWGSRRGIIEAHPAPDQSVMINIHELLELAIRHRASAPPLKAGSPPALRIDGTVVSTKLPAISAGDMDELAHSVVYSASRDHLLRFHSPDKEGDDIPNLAEEHLR